MYHDNTGSKCSAKSLSLELAQARPNYVKDTPFSLLLFFSLVAENENYLHTPSMLLMSLHEFIGAQSMKCMIV